ncbi:MAG: right-handed parallel beta-helix repeat-containing protein, partial [Deltaproteobacteria bacterium]|nr:right-handed parallel beta-helix repeat-containing protein [Deltaproteobacteria bacterium]
WPKDSKKPAKIEVPLLTELVRIEGKIDVSGPKDQPVRNIELSGITFTEGDRFSWVGLTGMGLQHDWERFDKPTALVRLRGAEGCVIANDRFVHSGHTGLRLDLYAQKNRVESNLFANLGGVGILLAGYGPGTKDVNKKNIVQNNYVHHIGTRYWASSGIFVWQSGENTIAHNRLHDLPYSGIVVSGRIVWDPKGVGECSGTIRWDEVKAATGGIVPARTWEATEPFLHGRKNIVLRNDVHDVVKVLKDGNCIYVSGTGKGNIVRENSCHDSFGEGLNAGLRCDDMQHETLLEGNFVQRYGGLGEGIISKGRNDLVNNFLVDLRPSLKSHRGYIVLVDDPPTGAKIQHNVFYSRRAGQHLYGQGIPYGKKPPVYLSQADADSNIYFCAADPTWATEHLKTERLKGVEAHSRQGDPLFADLRGGDLSFAATSQAPAMGIKPATPFAAIGLDPSVHARLIGTELKTTISPPSGVASFPRQVTIKSSDPLAEIRYTLDGSEPSASSTHAIVYTGPFTLAWPATVRARAFSKGKAGVDLVRASEDYGLPPGWIAEGFEAVPLGAKTPVATTSAESATRSALVSAAQAATGKHSLRFSDGPGQVYAYNPHVYYRPGLSQGRLRLRFAFYLDAATVFYAEWRDYTSATPYAKGPTLTVNSGGHVTFGGAQTTVPIGRWIIATVVATLGSGGSHTATATLTWKGGSHTFPSATHANAFSRLDWLG